MTIAVFVIGLLNVSLAATTGDDKGKEVSTPVPEVIECEKTKSCEMTDIDKLKLPNDNDEKKTDKK